MNWKLIAKISFVWLTLLLFGHEALADEGLNGFGRLDTPTAPPERTTAPKRTKQKPKSQQKAPAADQAVNAWGPFRPS
jgi:hypothetical protein